MASVAKTTIPPTMKAAQYAEYSSDSKEFSSVSVREVPVPTLGANDVLVRVIRAALNPCDWQLLTGRMKDDWPQPMPATVGFDFSGEVAAVGDAVKNFKIGEDVWAVNWGKHQHYLGEGSGHSPAGAFAEYIKIPANQLSRKPADVSHDVAAAVALAGTTAYQGLFTHLQVQKGQKLLILGGASAVGTIAAQLAKTRGVDVTVTVSTRALEFAKQTKADHVIDYTKTKWWEGGIVYDAVFDTVGEKDGFAHAKLALRPDGSYLSIANFEVGTDPKAHAPLKAYAFVLENSPADQDQLVKLIQSKELTVPIEDTFPFTTEGVRAILIKQKEAKSLGKNILIVSNDNNNNASTTATTAAAAAAAANTNTSLPSSMKAASYADYSQDTKEFSAVSVKQVPVPSLGPKDVLVRVLRAALNPIDSKVMCGYLKQMWPLPLPATLGYDFSGHVAAVGSEVKDFKIGEDVWAVNWGPGNHYAGEGHTPASAFAEYIKIPSSQLSRKPADVSHDIAAAVALVGTTAYQGLFTHLQVQKGQKLLILGGTSAVGFLAAQLAKLRGVELTVTVSTRSLEFVQQTKPDHVIDYTKNKWWEGGKVYDAVFDTVGEADGFAHAKLVLPPNGAFTSIANFEVGYDPKAHLPLRAYGFCLSNSPAVQDELIGLVRSKQLIVPIDSSFPFTTEGVRDCLKKQEGGKSLGKNLLIVS